jgi:hypothetical protein
VCGVFASEAPRRRYVGFAHQACAALAWRDSGRARAPAWYTRTVTYDDFKREWVAALRSSGLHTMGVDSVDESLDLRRMERTCGSAVEAVGQDVEPFHVAGTLKWRWRALHDARTATNEEDMLTELLGREDVRRVRTQRPWIRVDVTLHSSALWGKEIPMPGARTWAAWAREAVSRLESIEPVVPAETVREARGGRLEILAWQGEPEAHLLCSREGDLRLRSVEVSAWQAVHLARKWDDSSRKPDTGTAKQLRELFARIRAALHAWVELTDHLLRTR